MKSIASLKTVLPAAQLSAQLMAERPWPFAIRRGFLLSLPLVMVGSFAIVLGSVDLSLLTPWRELFHRAGQATFGIIALCLVVTISQSLALLRKERGQTDISPMVAAIVALISFLAFVIPTDKEIALDLFGTRSVFTALFTAIAATEIFLRLARARWLTAFKAFSDQDPLLPGVLRSVPPAALTIFIFLATHALLTELFGASVGEALRRGIVGIFELADSSLSRALLFNVLNHLLWFVGAHGNHILNSGTEKFFDSATAINQAAVMAGGVPTEIVTKPFFDVFVFMGGCGAAFALIVALLIVSRGSNSARLARIGSIPAVFNISEVVVFGLPIVFNPIFFLPFLLAPLALVMTTYAAMSAGWVPLTTHPINWTTPPLLGGYLATGSWRGTVLQLVNLAAAILIYLPFVRAAEKQVHESRQKTFRLLLASMNDLFGREGPHVLKRPDAIGNIARQLSADLMPDVERGRLYLIYQPQVDRTGRVHGVEALLRWDHESYGAVPPPIVVGIAEEARLICRLGDWVINRACAQLATWRAQGERTVRMSINVSPTQLAEPGFAERVRARLTKYGLSPHDVELEITESRVIGHDDATVAAMGELSELGVNIAMDDFGMGYSSLLYMRRFRIHAIKLDGSLTRDVLHNRSCQDIIQTIAHLCRSQHVRIVAEFVETAEQRDLLERLGCSEYQGYLYTKPLLPDECLAFISTRNDKQATAENVRAAFYHR